MILDFSEQKFNVKFRLKTLPFIVFGLMLVVSCSITRNVPEGRYLLNKSTIEVDSKGLNSGDLETYLKQHPNKEILGFRFHLRIFNIASPYKFNRMNRWLKTIGEEPVLLDTNLISEGTRNVLLYLQSKGYYKIGRASCRERV